VVAGEPRRDPDRDRDRDPDRDPERARVERASSRRRRGGRSLASLRRASDDRDPDPDRDPGRACARARACDRARRLDRAEERSLDDVLIASIVRNPIAARADERAWP
jgi:hypothetical protein